MNTLLLALRWLIGLFALMFGFVTLISISKVAGVVGTIGALIAIPLSGRGLARLLPASFLVPEKQAARHALAMGACVALGIASLIVGTIEMMVRGTPTETASPVTAPIVPDRVAPASATPADAPGTTGPAPPAPPTGPTPAPPPAGRVADGAVMLIEGEGWDRTRREWGAAGIRRINAAMPLAAERVARSPECDVVEMVGLSDRSKPPSDIVLYLDCGNGKRFYVSDDELTSAAPAVSKNAQTAAISDTAAVRACEDSVKAQLNFPSTFDRDLLNTSVYRPDGGNIAVMFTFQAKNALGVELPQRARCVLDDQGIHPAEISNE